MAAIAEVADCVLFLYATEVGLLHRSRVDVSVKDSELHLGESQCGWLYLTTACG